MRTGIVYKIENILSGKIYIGQTIVSIQERWSGHKCDSKRRNTPLYASMRKHGDSLEDVFKITILEEDIELTHLDQKEIDWIKELNSIHPNGYNLSNGGQGFLTVEEREQMSERVRGENNPMYGMCGELNPFYGKKHSESTRALLSEMGKKRVFSEETRAKIGYSTAQRHKELGHPMQGRCHTEESKKKISEAMKNRFVSDETKTRMSDNHARKRVVIMLDKKTEERILVFDSMKKASDWLRENTEYSKAKSGEISNVCRGVKKTAYGFKWEYLEGVETIPSGSRMDK